MANQCSFCEMRHIETNMMVLGTGAEALWVEFCSDCGDRHVLTNEKGENWLVREVWDSINHGAGYVRKPADVMLANDLAKAAEEHAAEDREYDDYANLLAAAQANPWAVSV
jgi:hypothetical protein